MAFLFVTALLVIGAVLAVVGVVASSFAAFLVASILSGLAIVVLWRITSSARETTFVSDAPLAEPPHWDKPLRSSEPSEDDSSEVAIPEVAIDGYDDLLATEILPSLETLSVEELEAVIKRERQGLGRVAVMNRAQVLIDLTIESTVEISADTDLAAGSSDLTVELTEPGVELREDAQSRRRTPGTSRASPELQQSVGSAGSGPTRARKGDVARSQAESPTNKPKRPTNEKQQVRERKGPDLSI